MGRTQEMTSTLRTLNPGRSAHARPWVALAAVTVVAAFSLLVVPGCNGGGAPNTAQTGGAPSSIPGTAADPGQPATLGTSVPVPAPVTPVGPAAPDPLAAVQSFARAELERDANGAWSLLSEADRARYTSPQVWAGERSQRPHLRAIEGVAVLEPSASAPAPALTGNGPAGSVTVTAVVRFDPALDQNLGMIPTSASARWLAVPEDGGWRVAYQRSSFDAHLPPLAALGDTARQWVRARQGCEIPGSGASISDENRLEVVGGVVGVAGLANRLCNTNHPVRTGTPTPLDPAESAAVVAAFGPQSLQWAQVVPLAGAVPQRLVMGPLGERWIAIGVLAP